jgi:hypothetical protein
MMCLELWHTRREILHVNLHDVLKPLVQTDVGLGASVSIFATMSLCLRLHLYDTGAVIGFMSKSSHKYTRQKNV